MNTNKFKNSIGGNTETDKMPVLFVGHGNPMYAISDNKYSKVWREMGKKLVKPKAILCVSAHWLTKGTYVTMMENPKTIKSASYAAIAGDLIFILWILYNGSKKFLSSGAYCASRS